MTLQQFSKDNNLFQPFHQRWRACHNKNLAAAIVFCCRNPSLIDLVKNNADPLQSVRADTAVTESDINFLKQTLTKYGKTLDVKIYSEAPHGFFNNAREL